MTQGNCKQITDFYIVSVYQKNSCCGTCIKYGIFLQKLWFTKGKAIKEREDNTRNEQVVHISHNQYTIYFEMLMVSSASLSWQCCCDLLFPSVCMGWPCCFIITLNTTAAFSTSVSADGILFWS